MDSCGSYNAAMTTRLVESIKDQNAIAYGDSRFGGVKAAYWLLLQDDPGRRDGFRHQDRYGYFPTR